MGVNIGLFEDRGTFVEGMTRFFKWKGFTVSVIESLGSWNQFKNFNHLDAAVIHAALHIRQGDLLIESKEVIARLPRDCRRILTSGHTLSFYSKECLSLGADFYCHDLTDDRFIEILRKGRVSDEEIDLRGTRIIDEGNRVYKREMGFAPDAGLDDEGRYKAKARRGERD